MKVCDDVMFAWLPQLHRGGGVDPMNKKPNKRGISRKVTYITSWYEWKGARLSSSGVSKIPVLVARDVELPTPTIPWSGKDKDGNGWQVMFRT